MGMTPEGVKKREQTLIAKHGSMEAYRAKMREYASQGGKTITENTKKRGFGTNRERAVFYGHTSKQKSKTVDKSE